MEYPRTRGDILQAFGSFLASINLPYVVVGDTTEYPARIDSDVDIVVPASVAKNLQQIVKIFAEKEGLSLVQLLHHETSAWYFVLFWGSKSPTENIALDICGDYLRDGKPLLCADELLQGRQIAQTDDEAEKGFYVSAPEMEFIYYLLKKVDKGAIDQRQFRHLREQYALCPEGCLQQMSKFWPLKTSRAIGEWLQNDELSALTQAITELKVGLVSNCRPELKPVAMELYRKAKRVLQPTGLVVVLLGPDGCGKSAVGDRLVTELAPAFRGIKRFHLRPFFIGSGLAGSTGEPVTDPHGQAPRAVLPSVAKLFYFLADYVGGYWAKSRPMKVRSHLVLFDRYYHDMLIDPRRYRYGAPMVLANFAARFIPTPDVFLVLDAPVEIIHSRKQEVSLAETKRQREAYLRFAQNNPNCIVLNTDQDIEATLKVARSAVLAFMEKRLDGRMGLF